MAITKCGSGQRSEFPFDFSIEFSDCGNHFFPRSTAELKEWKCFFHGEPINLYAQKSFQFVGPHQNRQEWIFENKLMHLNEGDKGRERRVGGKWGIWVLRFNSSFSTSQMHNFLPLKSIRMENHNFTAVPILHTHKRPIKKSRRESGFGWRFDNEQRTYKIKKMCGNWNTDGKSPFAPTNGNNSGTNANCAYSKQIKWTGWKIKEAMIFYAWCVFDFDYQWFFPALSPT